MKQNLSRLLLISLVLFPALAFADIAILIHGYHSGSKSWRNSGISSVLFSKGWHDISLSGKTLQSSGKYFIAVELPSKAPIDVQSNYLSQYLRDIVEQNPAHKIHLIAHSAGGIVARLSLVKNYKQFIDNNDNAFLPVVQLITIATPHLGSPIAEMAHSASDTPISVFAPLFGLDEINQAEILYKQLSREHKNNFLYWLNRQPHPPIRYTSIVRADGSLITGDVYVPPHSQNMAFVPAIKQQSHLVLTPGNHKLKASDGIVISHLLP